MSETETIEDTPAAIRERVRSTLQEYLADNLVRIVIDATHPGVLVPLKHKHNRYLHLNLSFRFEGHRMAYDLDAFRVNMTFEGADFRVTIPYDAFLAASPIPREEEPGVGAKAKKVSHLKIVK